MNETAQALDYLSSHNVLTLGTVGVDGPWSAAVFYVNRRFTFYFLSAATTRHAANIAENPSVAGTVHEDYSDWTKIKGVQLEGRAAVIHGRERAAAMALYASKFAFAGRQAPGEIVAALKRVQWYRLEPERLYMIDNSIGFGHRDEISLP